jgi:hypothetical protein
MVIIYFWIKWRLINALELFSGLIIFAESKFEEKARFLFDLFDFNELNSLSLVIIVINDIYFRIFVIILC